MSEIQNYVAAWAENTTSRLRANIDKLKVKDIGELKLSIGHKISLSGNNIRVKHYFMLKGKFSDQGAGRGQKANTKTTKRQAKKWFSHTMYGQVAKLQFVVQAKIETQVRKIFEQEQ